MVDMDDRSGEVSVSSQMSVSSAAKELRDSENALHAGLEPLLFAYGDEDGQLLFENIIRDPERLFVF